MSGIKERAKRGKGERGKNLSFLLPPVFPARLKAIRAPETLYNDLDLADHNQTEIVGHHLKAGCYAFPPYSAGCSVIF
jgi:hypothetical protein